MGPTDQTATLFVPTNASSSSVRSIASERTNATSGGISAFLMSFPSSRRRTRGPRTPSRTSARPRRAANTPGDVSRSTRAPWTRALRTSPAFARRSGPRDCRRAPSRRIVRGGSGGPRRIRVASESRRRSWETRRAAFAAVRRRSIRPAPPARSSNGNSGDVEARWPTTMNRRTGVAEAPGIESLSPGASVLDRVPEFLGEFLEQVAHAHPEDPLHVLLRELDLPSPPRRGRVRRALPFHQGTRGQDDTPQDSV